MPKLKPSSRIASLTAQRAALDAEIAKEAAVEKSRLATENSRRAALLGAAVLHHFKGEELAAIIRAAVPAKVKSKPDLALFAEWLGKAGATETG